MSSKLKSMLAILIIYLIVIIAGTAVYLWLSFTLPLLVRVLIADVTATLLIWLLSLILKNASLYDPYWSVIPPVILFFVMMAEKTFTLPLVVLLSALSLWAIRLTYNWGKLWQDFSHVDWRYENFKKMAPRLYPLISFFGIMLFPTLIVFAQLIGPLAMIEVQTAKLGVYSVLGALTIISATILQFVADSQMQTFKLDPSNKGKIMQEGVWKHSRHPNYLGEIFVWWGTYLFTIDAFGFSYFIIFPILMTLMFRFISVPLLENKILRTRPEYNNYKQTARMFIPIKK
jgi:steroid 5-alpha reductase family enzyme